MGKSVLVLGCGSSGVDAAKLLTECGEPVILYDGNTALDTEKVKEKVGAEVSFLLGELKEEDLGEISYAVISPGISPEKPFVELLKAKGIEVRSEIELAYLYEKGTVIGITGTNGKTTTTSLVGDIMKAALGDEKAFTVGNIGIPYASKVLKTGKDSATTIELSSFQLETIYTFRPHVAAILNITPDHLDRHHTMEGYAAVKEGITKNQTKEDFIVLNYEDERLRAFGESGLIPTVIWFSGIRALENGYFLEDDVLYKSVNGVREALVKTDEVNLVGRCNYENILAAMAITEAMGINRETILSVVKNFKAVPHRIEFTKEVRGVRYYNDSKGTNPDAAIQGIRAMNRKTVLIGGGYDKGLEFDDWIKEFGDKVKKLILLGVTAEKIAETAKKYGFTDIVFVDSLEEAVKTAYETAEPGEAVLLSPACASWGMFRNFEERGDLFKALVRELKE